MRSLTLASLISTAALVWGCGGSGSYSGSSSSAPTAPSPTPATSSSSTSSAVTISIVGSSGSAAFTPNPAQVATGSQFVIKNNDSTTHHIVMDDGSADLGTVSPGATTSPMTLNTSGGNFHCTIHPSMVGSINGASAPTPPSSGTTQPY